MLPQTELVVYESAINLPLLNDIIAFVRDTSKADSSKQTALRQSCIFLDHDAKGSAFQEKYGFLYLGELLERYEERFGMSVQDFRAIALALGYTRDMTDDSMFIGPQRRIFIRQLVNKANGDVYLTGALYLLNKDSNAVNPYEKTLYETNYAATEEALFALSLLQDQEQAFSRFKPLLLRLLGPDRTMPALGNMKALDWLIAWLTPRIKAVRGKDMALFRALAALPVSFVKPESKHHTALLGCGWAALEIAYANMMTVLSRSVKNALNPDSLVAEKIAVNLFQEVLSHEATLSEPVYEQLSVIFARFQNFRIKCNGCESLLEALNDSHIQNSDTALWFMNYAKTLHPAFRAFDILDAKWDALASTMERVKYIDLFENSLTEDLDASGIQSRIARYDALTGSSYLDAYREGGRASRFGLLVNKGVLDLWQCFQDSLDDAGLPMKPCMIRYIRQYLYGLSTIQAYQFYEGFFKTYPVLYLERYFGYDYRTFYNALVDGQTHYSNGYREIKLKIQRNFLDARQKRQLLKWLEEYIFAFEPDLYLSFAEAILRDEKIAELFSVEEQRALFRLVIHQPDLFWQTANELKQRYLSQEELQAEQDAKNAAAQEAARQKEQDQIQKIRDNFSEKFKGTFASITDFLNDYRYRHEESQIACRIVREHLNETLEEKSYELDGKDAVWFLQVCAELVRKGAMAFHEAQTYISAVKERDENAE